MSPIHVLPVAGIPEIVPGSYLPDLIGRAAGGHSVQDGDIFVVAQKIVSKAEGRIVRLDDVVPSAKANAWAAEWNKDARVVELVLRESRSIVRMERGLIIAETHHGHVCANAGVDQSNAPEGTAILLPEDPDASAGALQATLSTLFGVHVAVIVSDTFGRAWREGLVNVALGVAGMMPLTDYRGQSDALGRTLNTTVIATADEVAAAAELVMGKADGIPVVIVRGVSLAARSGSGRDLLRPKERDLFR